MKKNVGFISFRLSGTDGVSLETKKWTDIFTRNGFNCYYYGGELDASPEVSFEVPEAHFHHPRIQEIYRECFDNSIRPAGLTAELHKYREIL
ncbi:MAG: glycosyltransferase family 1 protein, partial [Spirochaetaceae bacterium]|nr:glycosyltransferase family 1 protein [Spirochaetaceae bacterium]